MSLLIRKRSPSRAARHWALHGLGNGRLIIWEIEMAVLDETFVPSDKDIEKAKAFSRTLAREIAPESRITLHREGDGEAIEIPDILNVSRPFLNMILDLGEVSHRKVGRNRRVKFSDVLAYKKQQERRSKDALQELADEAQELLV